MSGTLLIINLGKKEAGKIVSQLIYSLQFNFAYFSVVFSGLRALCAMRTVCIWYQINPKSCGMMIGMKKITFDKRSVVAGAELPGPRYSQYLSLFALH